MTSVSVSHHCVRYDLPSLPTVKVTSETRGCFSWRLRHLDPSCIAHIAPSCSVLLAVLIRFLGFTQNSVCTAGFDKVEQGCTSCKLIVSVICDEAALSVRSWILGQARSGASSNSLAPKYLCHLDYLFDSPLAYQSLHQEHSHEHKQVTRRSRTASPLLATLSGFRKPLDQLGDEIRRNVRLWE